jgi:acyl transferase domain-containing protein
VVANNSQVPLKNEPWPHDGPRRASVNSFGFGGTNAHIIIDDADHYLALKGLVTHALQTCQPKVNNPLAVTRPVLESNHQTRVFVLSAESQKSLERSIENLHEYLLSHGDDDFRIMDALAYTLFSRRSHFTYRTSYVAADINDLAESLYVRKEKLMQISSVHAHHVAFVFTGQGASWHVRTRAHYTLTTICRVPRFDISRSVNAKFEIF